MRKYLIGFLLALALVFGMASSFSNLGPFSSILWSTSNPLADAEATAYFDDIDEIVASDGSGLDDLVTVGAFAGARVGFTHTTSGATLVYVLKAGSPSASSPWIVLPDDAGSSGLYFALEQHFIGGIPLIPSQSDTTKFYRAYAVVDGDGDVLFKLDDTAITITD